MNRPTEPAPRRLFGSWLSLVVVAVVVVLAVAAVSSYRDLEAARERKAQLEAEIEQTRQRIRQLERRIGRLEDDPALLEKLAREELRMVRPGDAVLFLPASETPTEPHQSPGAARPPDENLLVRP